MLVRQGCRHSHPTARRYVTTRLAATGKPRDRVNAAKAPAPPLPSAKPLSFDWVRRRADREVEEPARLDAIRGQGDELSAALDMADEFTALIRKQAATTLTDWLTRAEPAACPEVGRLAEEIRRDEAAVTGPWSNGPVEGSREPSEDDQTADVWPSRIPTSEGERSPRHVTEQCRAEDHVAVTRSAGEPDLKRPVKVVVDTMVGPVTHVIVGYTERSLRSVQSQYREDWAVNDSNTISTGRFHVRRRGRRRSSQAWALLSLQANG